MTDPTEQLVRRGLAELVRNKPELGPVDMEAVVAPRSGGRRVGGSHPSMTRWPLVAAVLVVVAGVGVANWLGLSQGQRGITTEPQQRPDPLPSAGASTSSASSKRTSDPGGGSADYFTYFETPSDILRLSDEVVIGTVEGERRGTTYGPPDGRVQNRILRVSVERILKGSPSDSVDVVTWGWSKFNGKERPSSPANEVRLKVGDRALLALAVGKDGERGVMNEQAVFLLAEGQVVDTDRNGPVVKQLETLSEPQLVDVVQGRR